MAVTEPVVGTDQITDPIAYDTAWNSEMVLSESPKNTYSKPEGAVATMGEEKVTDSPMPSVAVAYQSGGEAIVCGPNVFPTPTIPVCALLAPNWGH